MLSAVNQLRIRLVFKGVWLVCDVERAKPGCADAGGLGKGTWRLWKRS
jgi:hypothetical protein